MAFPTSLVILTLQQMIADLHPSETSEVPDRAHDTAPSSSKQRFHIHVLPELQAWVLSKNVGSTVGNVASNLANLECFLRVMDTSMMWTGHKQCNVSQSQSAQGALDPDILICKERCCFNQQPCHKEAT